VHLARVIAVEMPRLADAFGKGEVVIEHERGVVEQVDRQRGVIGAGDARRLAAGAIHRSVADLQNWSDLLDPK